MYNSFVTQKILFFKNRELRNHRRSSIENIFQIILTFNSDFLGYSRIQHVQQFFHKKNLFFKNPELRNYRRLPVDNKTILTFNSDFLAYRRIQHVQQFFT